MPKIKNCFKKRYSWAVIFSILLMGFFTYALIDTFLITKIISSELENNSYSENEENAAEPVITDNSYSDNNIKITIETLRQYDTTVYVADVVLSDASYLKTALAQNSYGRNIKETTSAIAEENNAILAINGDYYGFRNTGIVLRNKVLYRNAVRNSGDDLIIDTLGNFSIASESSIDINSLDISKISQIFSFGPALIENGEITVNNKSEVSQSKSSNPRTAIGQISSLHYVIIVSDGRTSESTGLSLLELAEIFKEKECIWAYNLDGGGSSAMYFNGNIVNNPTDGKSIGEREVSDIVYIGY